MKAKALRILVIIIHGSVIDMTACLAIEVLENGTQSGPYEFDRMNMIDKIPFIPFILVILST